MSWLASRTSLLATLFLLLAIWGCNWFPRTVKLGDPRIQTLLAAAATFPRTQYGFTALPSDAHVRWESRPRAGYDAMLHISSKTYRTIAFRKDPQGYRWIGEQETFTGPHEYTTVDGTFKEEIVLTYEIEHISGVPLNQLHIAYQGDDRRLSWPHVLTLTEARSILKAWGY
jgi:hypothetical protein